MDLKLFILLQLLQIILITTFTNGGVLRRTPKVYNALITTDENLTPSRAYPVIQPHLHETAITYPSFSFSSYSSFEPFETYSNTFNHFPSIPTFYAGRNNNNIPLLFDESINTQSNNNNNNNNNNDNDNNNEDKNSKVLPNVDDEINKKEINNGKNVDNEIENNSDQTNIADESIKSNINNDKEIPTEKLPIELNEFGLPPSLIPISSVSPSIPSFPNNPINLLPFPYNSPYPLIFDQYNGYQTNPYLPAFGYYPPHQIHYNEFNKYPIGSNNNNNKNNGNDNNKNEEAFSTDFLNQQTAPEQQQQQQSTNLAQKINNLNDNDALLISTAEAATNPNANMLNENIKNNLNKNNNIPDVAPPPIPSGGDKTIV